MKTTKQGIENTVDATVSADMPNEDRELFCRAITEAMEAKMRKIEEEMGDMPMPPLSRRHKIRMNRLFRECVGGSFCPFPEEYVCESAK